MLGLVEVPEGDVPISLCQTRIIGEKEKRLIPQQGVGDELPLPPGLGPLSPGPHPPHRPTGHVQRSHLVANPDDEDDEQSDERDDELAAEQAEGDAAGSVLVEALANYTNPRPGSPGHPDPD